MIERLTARTIAILLGAVVLLAGLAYLIWHWQHGMKVNTRVDQGQAGAVSNSAGYSLNRADTVAGNASDIDRTAQDGVAAIDKAEAGNSNDAAMRAQCATRTYRDKPFCASWRALK